MAIIFEFQCTFWCSVLSDPSIIAAQIDAESVSMHLLVLSAFRPCWFIDEVHQLVCFNAPSGAQCFPTVRAADRDAYLTAFQCTFWCSVLSDVNDDRVEVP